MDDDPADLRHFGVAFRARHVAEAVLADAGARVQDHAVAELRMDDRAARPDRAIAADTDIRADHRVGADEGAGADLDARADHGAGVDRHAGAELCRRMHVRAGHHAIGLVGRDRPQPVAIELARHQDEGAVGLARAEQVDVRRHLALEASGGQHRAGLGGRERGGEFRIVDEAEVGGAGVIDRRDVGDPMRQRRSVPWNRTGQRRDLGESQRFRAAHWTHRLAPRVARSGEARIMPATYTTSASRNTNPGRGQTCRA